MAVDRDSVRYSTGHRVYVVLVAGMLEVMWRKELHMRPSPSSLCVHDGALVVAGQHSRLFRLHPLTGEVLWQVSVGDAHGTAAVGSDVVVYLDQMGVLSCFELGDGSLRWSKQGEWFSGYLSVAESSVLVGGWRGYERLGARSLASGRVLWRSKRDRSTGRTLDRWRLPGPVVDVDLEASFAATPSGSVVFRTGSFGVVELSSDGVSEIWRSPNELGSSAPIQVQDRCGCRHFKASLRSTQRTAHRQRLESTRGSFQASDAPVTACWSQAVRAVLSRSPPTGQCKRGYKSAVEPWPSPNSQMASQSWPRKASSSPSDTTAVSDLFGFQPSRSTRSNRDFWAPQVGRTAARRRIRSP